MSDAVCLHCGGDLPPANGRGRRRQYCRPACRWAARRQRQKTLPTQPPNLFSREVHQALFDSRLPLRAVSARMTEQGYDVTPGTLSNWQNGRSTPRPTPQSRDRLLALERTLGIPPTRLYTLLGPTVRRVGTSSPPTRQNGSTQARLPATASHHQIKQLLEQRIAMHSGFSRTQLLLTTVQEHYTVGADQLPRHSDMTLQVYPTTKGIDQYWYIYTYELCAPAVIEAGDGCELGRTLFEDLPTGDDASVRLGATRLRFPDPLKPGVPHTFSYRLRFDRDDRNESLPDLNFKRALTASPACRLLDLQIAFDPQKLPATLSRCKWRYDACDKKPTESIRLKPGLVGDKIRLDNPGRGAYGWQWSWPEQ